MKLVIFALAFAEAAKMRARSQTCVGVHCDDNVDSWGQGCDYYEDYPEECGKYDVTGGFVADDVCDACGYGYIVSAER